MLVRGTGAGNELVVVVVVVVFVIAGFVASLLLVRGVDRICAGVALLDANDAVALWCGGTAPGKLL